MPVLPVTKMRLSAMPSPIGSGANFPSAQMQRRKSAGDDAVHLFGKRLRQIAGAQTGFDVRYGNPVIERGHGAGHGGCGVALYHCHIESSLARSGSSEASTRLVTLRQCLAVSHQIKVEIGTQDRKQSST